MNLYLNLLTYKKIKMDHRFRCKNKTLELLGESLCDLELNKEFSDMSQNHNP